jgi:hypothetical protein
MLISPYAMTHEIEMVTSLGLYLGTSSNLMLVASPIPLLAALALSA